jgi:hypothetical protein
MGEKTFRRLISQLAIIEYEIDTGTTVHPVRANHRWRPRDEAGRYCA